MPLAKAVHGAQSAAVDLDAEPYAVRRVNLARFDPSLRPARVAFEGDERPGTIVIDPRARQLFLVEGAGEASRYGIAVGAAGRGWRGQVTVGRKARWPAWYPTDEMKRIAPGMPAQIAPGPDNPLGARAFYLYSAGRDTMFRIHGTSEPWSIGHEVSSGCFRMFNEDVIAIFDRVPVGAKVVVL